MTGVTEECALGAVQLSLQLLSSFSVVDIYVGSIPFDDLARFIPQRVGTEQEPSIFSIETADACFDLARLAGRENRSPVLDESVQVIRVNGFGPPPVQYVLDRDPGKVEPALVEEISFTIRIGCPRQRRDRVHDRPKLILHSFTGTINRHPRDGGATIVRPPGPRAKRAEDPLSTKRPRPRCSPAEPLFGLSRLRRAA